MKNLKKISKEEMENTVGGRFLGWGWSDYTSSSEVINGCLVTTTVQSYTVFGLDTGISRTVTDTNC